MARLVLAAFFCAAAFPAMAQVHNLSKVSALAGSGNFTVPSNVYQIHVNMCGGGGGGGGVAAGAASSAAGGTSGEWLIADVAVTPGEVIAYAVGAAGTGGAAGNNNGANGGNTTFGALEVYGGLGGTGSASGNAAALGGNTMHTRRHRFTPTAALRVAGGGIAVNVAGQASQSGSGGDPGNTIGFGGSSTTDADGAVAAGFCAGGSGGNNAAGTTARAGGNGTAGTIYLTY